MDLRSVCFLGIRSDADPAIIEWLHNTLNEGVASETYAELTDSQMMTPKVWDIEGMTQYCEEAYNYYVGLLAE